MRPDLATIAPLLAPRHHELATRVGGFAAERLAGRPAPKDDAAARREARRLLEILGGEGWCRWAVPAAWGGAAEEIDLVACCLVREALAAASPLADAVFALQCLGSMPTRSSRSSVWGRCRSRSPATKRPRLGGCRGSRSARRWRPSR